MEYFEFKYCCHNCEGINEVGITQKIDSRHCFICPKCLSRNMVTMKSKWIQPNTERNLKDPLDKIIYQSI